MRQTIRYVAVSLVCFFVFLDFSSAAPPASCANKFIGTWSFSGGTTTVSANGMAYPHCAMCVATQTWTCQGNTYLFSNSGPPGQFTATLVDANHMSYGTGVATRVGGQAAVAKPKPESAATAVTPNAEKPSFEATRKNAARTSQPDAKRLSGEALSCNPGTQDIAGCISVPQSSNPGVSGAQQLSSSTSSTGKKAQIAQAKSYVQAALTVKQSDPTYSGWSAAAAQFRKAAEAFKAAGDLASESAANNQAQTLETALKFSKQNILPASQSNASAKASPAVACSGGDAGYPDTFWQAGNLNQRYGSSWSCKMISLVPQSACELYNSCLPCMDGNEDFYQDSRNTGHCIARASGADQIKNPVQSPPGQATQAAAAPKPPLEVESQRQRGTTVTGASLETPLLPPGSVCEGSLCAISVAYPPLPPLPNGSCNWPEAKINLEWVLQDAGAKATYFMWRGYRMDPVHAVIQAQAHNRHAQQTLVNCFSRLSDALAGDDPSSRNPKPEPLPNRQLTIKDCHCVTILPAGGDPSSGRPEYIVKNSCVDPFMMSVTMLDSVGSSKPALISNSEHEFLMPSGKQINYSAADGGIVSIYGWSLRDAASKLQCFVPQ